jgi:hypothetical protein
MFYLTGLTYKVFPVSLFVLPENGDTASLRKVVFRTLSVKSSLMMEAVRTSETSVDNHFTRQYNPEDNSEHQKESC